jgi:hypothetical protein
MADSLGACLLGNDIPFTGLAKDIFNARVNGKSWKEIGDEFDLGSPSAARKQFTKLTGITDYKVKGQELLNLAKGGLDPKLTAPKVKKFKMTDANTGKAASGIADIPKKLMVDGEETVIKLWHDGVGQYTKLAQQSGLTLEQVDKIVWREAMNAANGDVWKAHLIKNTSQEGIKAVHQLVYDLRSNGYSVAQISSHAGIPEGTVKQILHGEWKPSPFMNVLPKHPAYNPPIGGGARPQSPFGSKDFPLLTDAEMRQLYSGQLSTEVRSAVQGYTGSGYSTINGQLRGTYPASPSVTARIARMDQAMQVVTTPMTVTRGMSMDGFQMGYIGDGSAESIRNALEGVIFSDPGFLSTSIAPNGVFTQAVRLEIEVPPGAMGYYAQQISHHKSEYEYIMARDTNILITSVEEVPLASGYGTRWIVRGRVVV